MCKDVWRVECDDPLFMSFFLGEIGANQRCKRAPLTWRLFPLIRKFVERLFQWKIWEISCEFVFWGTFLWCFLFQILSEDFSAIFSQGYIAEHHRLTNHTIDWDSAQCLTYSTNCFQRLTLESWFTNLDRTPFNRCQPLPAPYQRFIHDINSTNEPNRTT